MDKHPYLNSIFSHESKGMESFTVRTEIEAEFECVRERERERERERDGKKYICFQF